MQEPREVSLESDYSTDLYPPAECSNFIGPVYSTRRSASTSSTTGRGTGRERCEKSASVKKAPVEEARRGHNQGTRESLDYGRSSETAGQVNASTAFLPNFLKMTVKEHDFAMIEDVEATIWRIRETIRVRELAATHRLGQMRRLLMLEEHNTWKREFGFDRIETAAEMDEKRSRTSTNSVPDPSFYRNRVIPRHPHTPAEFTLEMKVDVKGLRMENILSQPAPPQ